jgi:hypothetical protein
LEVDAINTKTFVLNGSGRKKANWDLATYKVKIFHICFEKNRRKASLW